MAQDGTGNQALARRWARAHDVALQPHSAVPAELLDAYIHRAEKPRDLPVLDFLALRKLMLGREAQVAARLDQLADRQDDSGRRALKRAAEMLRRGEL